MIGFIVFRQKTQYVVILSLGCRCCRPSVNTICGRIMIGLSLSSVCKRNMWSYYDWVYCLPSVNAICGRITIGLSLSFVSKHNMWSYYDWVYCLPSVNIICGHIIIGLWLLSSSVNTICGHIIIGLSLLSSISKHNMWSYYDWIVVVVRQ